MRPFSYCNAHSVLGSLALKITAPRFCSLETFDWYSLCEAKPDAIATWYLAWLWQAKIKSCDSKHSCPSKAKLNTQKNFSFATKKTVLKGKHLPIGLSFLSYKTTDLQYSILPSEEDIMLSFSAQMKSFAKQKLPLHPTIFLALRCLKNSTQKHSHHSNSLQVKLFPVFE